MKRIALLAGGGRLPLIFANEARKNGDYIVGLAVEGLTLPELEPCVDRIYWGNVTEVNRALDVLRSERVSHLVMAGRIPKAIIFNRGLMNNKIAGGLLSKAADSKDYTLMRAVALLLKKKGISVLDPSPYLSALIPKKGVIASRVPTKAEWADIRFGERMARKIAGMDIGQAVIIRNKLVLAVEAVEGTDEAIKRAGLLNGKGAVIVKVARPGQDMRLDIPTIGPETIDSLIESKAAVLAIEAKKTLVVDKLEIIKKADAAGIAVVAI